MRALLLFAALLAAGASATESTRSMAIDIGNDGLKICLVDSAGLNLLDIVLNEVCLSVSVCFFIFTLNGSNRTAKRLL